MEQKNKNALIGGLLAIVFIMAVGYAAFATQLTINGTANINSRWDVHISDIQVADTGTTTASSESQGTKDSDLTAEFSAKLQSPGDYVTYNVTVVNEGTLDAELSGIVFSQTNNGTGTAEAGDTVENQGTSYEGDNAIVYSYSNIQQGDQLEAETGSVTFQVKVMYNNKVQGQPDAKELTSKLKMTLTYEQPSD